MLNASYSLHPFLIRPCFVNIVGLLTHSLFVFAVRELDVPGDIYERKIYPFEFSTVEMPYETYNGVNVRLRYVIFLNIFF